MQYIYYKLQNTSSITSLFVITSRQYIFGMNYFSLFYLLNLWLKIQQKTALQNRSTASPNLATHPIRPLQENPITLTSSNEWYKSWVARRRMQRARCSWRRRGCPPWGRRRSSDCRPRCPAGRPTCPTRRCSRSWIATRPVLSPIRPRCTDRARRHTRGPCTRRPSRGPTSWRCPSGPVKWSNMEIEMMKSAL